MENLVVTENVAKGVIDDKNLGESEVNRSEGKTAWKSGMLRKKERDDFLRNQKPLKRIG